MDSMHCHFISPAPPRSTKRCAAVEPNIGLRTCAYQRVLKMGRRGALMIQVRLTNRVRLKTRLYGISVKLWNDYDTCHLFSISFVALVSQPEHSM